MPPVRRSANIATKHAFQTTQYWLMKSEPESRIIKGIDVKFSIDDLQAMPDATSQWDGVRNYKARNYLRDDIKRGDKVLFYHSNCKVPGIAGLAIVTKEGYPDYTAFDAKHPYYDPKSSTDAPKWFMVDVKFERKFDRILPLAEIKQHNLLKEMALVKQGRLSIQPVRQSEYKIILSLLE